jgi:hypothetical protein
MIARWCCACSGDRNRRATRGLIRTDASPTTC